MRSVWLPLPAMSAPGMRRAAAYSSSAGSPPAGPPGARVAAPSYVRARMRPRLAALRPVMK